MNNKNLLPIISYCIATLIMYKLSIYHNNKQYYKYTQWSRLQIILCIPFLFIKTHDISKIASDLMWYSAFGCAFSCHLFFLLTNYEPFFIITTRILSKFNFYRTTKYKLFFQILADFIIHIVPTILVYKYIDCRQDYKYKKYIWLLPAFIHFIYPYLLIKSWKCSKIYKIYKTYPNLVYIIGWSGTIIFYYLLSLCINSK